MRANSYEVQFGWFIVIAQWHGKHSHRAATDASRMVEMAGQYPLTASASKSNALQSAPAKALGESGGMCESRNGFRYLYNRREAIREREPRNRIDFWARAFPL
jgi:hypothetical protein